MPVRYCISEQFAKVRSIHLAAFTSDKDENQKSFFRSFGSLYQTFSSSICLSFYDVKPKAQSEQCAPYCTIGN
jgi:hypothetical protein